jgi:trk system potassium uptake protein TrkH
MNKRLVLYILGWVLVIEGLAMQGSTLVGLWYHEKTYIYFLVIGVALMVLGGIIVLKKPKNTRMYRKDGFAATALSWIVLSLAGCLPFYFSGQISSFINAFFETVSGFTTTGATILTDIEALDNCMLFWRAFSHWLGGMGVLVFLLAIIPTLGGTQSINLMKAESTGPDVGKAVPNLRTYAVILYAIYIGLSVIETVMLMCGGMYFFDAVTTTFSTAGTGGFASYNNSLAHFNSYYLQGVVSVFMILFGVNFAVYILLLTRKFKKAFAMTELWVYLGIIAFSVITIAIDIIRIYGNVFDSLHQSLFYVSSVISTTGFAITDTDKWPEYSKIIILILTCIGACGGSTGGGLKVSRLIILAKEVKKEFQLIIHPHTVHTIKIDGRKISHETTRSVSVYIIIYVAVIIFSTVIISLDGFDFITNFSGVLATVNNVGPGFSVVGSTGNYSGFSVLSKLVFCFDMLAGRLELYPLLLLFAPSAWKKN